MLADLKDAYVLQDIKDPKKLHILKNKEAFKNKNFSVARLQSDNPECNIPKNSTDICVDWSGINIYLSHDAFQLQ